MHFRICQDQGRLVEHDRERPMPPYRLRLQQGVDPVVLLNDCTFISAISPSKFQSHFSAVSSLENKNGFIWYFSPRKPFPLLLKSSCNSKLTLISAIPVIFNQCHAIHTCTLMMSSNQAHHNSVYYSHKLSSIRTFSITKLCVLLNL